MTPISNQLSKQSSNYLAASQPASQHASQHTNASVVVGAPQLLEQCKDKTSPLCSDTVHLLRDVGIRKMAQAFVWKTAVGLLKLLRVKMVLFQNYLLIKLFLLRCSLF
jgi:hypothetical protein